MTEKKTQNKSFGEQAIMSAGSVWNKLKAAGIIKIFVLWLVWVGIIIFLRSYAISQIHQPPVTKDPVANTSFLLQSAVKRDGIFYLKIVEEGYGTVKTSLPAFYPAFPYLVKGVSTTLGVGPVFAGLLINLVASFVAMALLYMIVKAYSKRESLAMLALVLFTFSPASFYMLAFYTEAIFCALSFGAFYFALKRKWLLACLFLAPLTAVRLPGLVVAGAVFVEYLSSIGWSYKKVRPNILYFLLAPLGLFAYMWLLWKKLGDPFMFRNAYKYGWQYQVLEPNIVKTVYLQAKAVFVAAINPPAGWKDDWFQGLATLGMQISSWLFGAAMAVYGVIRKIPAGWTAYMVLSLVLFSLNSNLVSVNRYIFPLFPVYYLIAYWLEKREGWVSGLVVGSSAVAMGVMLTLFSNGFWTG